MIVFGLVFSGLLVGMVTTVWGSVGIGPFRPVVSVIGALGLAVGLGVVVAGLVPLRQRTVFDATGIHSRGLLRTTHLPWPDSRAAFVVDVSVRRSHSTTSETGSAGRTTLTVLGQVEVSTGDRRTRLAAPRVSTSHSRHASASGSAEVRSRLEAEVDEIWAWAVSQGLVRDDGVYRPLGDADEEPHRGGRDLLRLPPVGGR